VRVRVQVRVRALALVLDHVFAPAANEEASIAVTTNAITAISMTVRLNALPPPLRSCASSVAPVLTWSSVDDIVSFSFLYTTLCNEQ
jgi:hypothetical protein